MGYYTRVLSKRTDVPPFHELARMLAEEHPSAVLSGDVDDSGAWTNLVLSHANGERIAAIEKNPVLDGELGGEEIREFLEEISDCKPASAVQWLKEYLHTIRTLYAFQHLSGSLVDSGDEVLHSLRTFIWKRGDAILQADGEGFTNEDGSHILWQFSENVSGSWWMAVRHADGWARFEMDLGDKRQREAFFEGIVPRGR